MAGRERLICAAQDVADGGDGVRFEFRRGDATVQAFAIRFRGIVHAYLNRCAHVEVELDWMPGKFFDESGTMLICATHGATYDPQSGRCLGGPCRGAGLMPVAVTERDGNIFLTGEGDDGQER